MNHTTQRPDYSRQLDRYVWALAALWTTLIAGALLWNHQLALGHGLLWLGGLVVIILGLRRLRQSERERRGSEEATETHKELLTEVLDSLPYPFLVIDANDFTIKTANRAAGADEPGAGATCYGLTHRRDAPCGSDVHVCPLDEVKRTKRPVTVEHEHYDIDGAPRFVEVHGYPIFGDDGKVVQMIEYCLDITDRRRTDAELRVDKERAEAASYAKGAHLESILENTSDLIVTSDTSGRIVSFNRGAEVVLGYDRQDAIGKHASMLFVDPAERERLIDRVNAGGSVSGYHARYAHKNRPRIVDVHLTLSQLRDADGAAAGFVGIGRDVSEQQRLQKALIQSEKMAAMGKLAASVAHEINNPLTGILTFAEALMDETPEDDPSREDSEIIFREAMRCRQIVRDLLDYSRLEKPKRARMSINRVVERSLTLIRGQAPFRDVSFDLGFADELPEVEVDVGQMQQLFLNLVINAGDAMGHRGTITIKSQSLEDNRMVQVSVSDEGCGIPPDEIDRIFDPFYSTKGEQGNGLGLNVVQSIVAQHGGTVRVETKAGQGTTFLVCLPVSSPSRPPDR